MISQTSIHQFKQIYKKEYGVDLSDDKAYELASNLTQLYKAVYIPENNKNTNQNYEKKP